MGFFLSRKNKYDIIVDATNIKSVVTKLSQDTIKINAKLDVPENTHLVIGKTGKALDDFASGTHFFSYANLPMICRRYGIDKIKDGEQQTMLNANLYLISKDLRALEFQTYRKVEMGTKAYGIFKIGVRGVLSYRVVKPLELMQSLLNQFDFIKTGEAEDMVSAWVNEVVVEELEKQNFIMPDIINNNPKIAECLKVRINKLFIELGLEIVDIRIVKYKLPKKYQADSDAVIAKIEESISVEDAIKDGDVDRDGYGTDDLDKQEQDSIKSSKQEDSTKMTENSQNDYKQECVDNKDYDIDEGLKDKNDDFDYVPFGNTSIENNEVAKKIKPQKTFVDLSLGGYDYEDKSSLKRCLNCGTENDIHADHCVLCGEKFNNEEI